MNESEPGNHSSSAARVHSAFFLPSRYKECECVGAQHKSSPHLHLLRTRDPYLNNDNRPMPCSFTAGTNEHSSDLDSACCTVIESLYANELVDGPPDRRKQSATSICGLLPLNAFSCMHLQLH